MRPAALTAQERDGVRSIPELCDLAAAGLVEMLDLGEADLL